MSRLLFVCHANMLRSVSAEYLARWLTGPSSPWEFEGAGVQALLGREADVDAAAALATRGIDTGGHQPQQLTARLLQRADLTLTFEPRQRAWAIREDPRRARTVLTIRRAATVLGGESNAGAEPLVAANSGQPGLDRLLADSRSYNAADDFADPVGTGFASVAAGVDEIESLLRVILPALGAPLAR